MTSELTFEQIVLTTIEKTLGAAVTATADLFNGSLFVTCTVAQAIQLETALLRALGCGIVISRFGEESAFDFV